MEITTINMGSKESTMMSTKVVMSTRWKSTLNQPLSTRPDKIHPLINVVNELRDRHGPRETEEE